MSPIAVACLAAFLAAGPAADSIPRPPAADIPAGSYRIDAERSDLVARVRYFSGLGHLDLRFIRMSGALQVAADDASASQVTIIVDAGSASSGERGLDRLTYRSLEPDKYPTIVFMSDRLRITGRGDARLQGRLTMHGVTRPITLRFSMTDARAGAGRIHFSGDGRISRRDFDVRSAAPFTADTVELRFEAEFVRTQPPPAPVAP